MSKRKANSTILDFFGKSRKTESGNPSESAPESMQSTHNCDNSKSELLLIEGDATSKVLPFESTTTATTVNTIIVKDKCQPLSVKPFEENSGRRAHNFNQRWYSDFPWLHYENDDVGVLCFECRKAFQNKLFASSTRIETAFIIGGVKNWKKAGNKFKSHSKSDMHSEAVLKNHNKEKGHTVVEQLSVAAKKEQAMARVALKAMFTSLQYCGQQGIAIRGHLDADGNYMSLLNLRSEDIPELKSFLQRSKSFTTHDIQNEILKLMANETLNEVLREVRKSGIFSVIVDETTDCSRKEQVSICARSVSDDMDIKEYFLGFYETSSTTSEALTNIVLDSLVRLALPIEMLRGQCYDGASNMRGVHNGVQAKIRRKQPLAVYVHCTNHSLNLALQDGVRKIPLIKNCLQWVHDVAGVFRTSKRQSQFLEIAQSYDEVPSKLLKPLCPTRWTVRQAAIDRLLKMYPIALEALEDLSESGTDVSSTALGLRDQFLKCEVYLGLLIAKEVFGAGEKLALALESPHQTINGALEAASFTVSYLKSVRTEQFFDTLWAKMIKAEAELGLTPLRTSRPRRVPRKLEHKNDSAESTNLSPKESIRRIYYEVNDVIVTQIEDRFAQEGMKKLVLLEEVFLRPVAEWTGKKQFQEALTEHGLKDSDLQIEMQMMNRVLTSQPKCLREIVEKYREMPEMTRKLFPSAWKLLKILLVVPASSATPERTFSALKRLKTYLRNTTGQSRLNHLAILHVYRDSFVQSLNIEKLCEEFAKANSYRATVFG